MWKYNHTSEPDELMHYGILGMKWGVRRYQNKDGSLTPAGKKRYGGDEIHEDYTKAHAKKSVKVMSNQDLQSANKRLNMEKQYADLTKKTKHGQQAVRGFIKGATTTAAVVSAAKVYSKYANEILDKVGDSIVGDIVIDSIH